MHPKYLILPAEVKARDLHARLYLAQKAARRGYTVLIGQSSLLHKKLPLFPRGIIFEDDVTYQGRIFIKKAHEMGYGLTATDEESIAVVSDKHYVGQRIHYPNLEKLLLFFTRGHGDLEEIQKQAPHSSKICPLVAAGNTRLDLLREKNSGLQTLNSPHEWDPNDVIVVNSRFSRSNPFSVSREKTKEVVRRKLNLSDEQFAFFCKYQDYTDQMFEEFIAMARDLPERFPDKQIVFRPHPSENMKPWQDIADRHDNAHCIQTATATQWSVNARVTVHYGCTTAIESSLLGSNVLAYRPIPSDDYDVRIPNALSTLYEDKDSLFEGIANAPALSQDIKKDKAKKARAFLSTLAAGCLEEEAADIILDALDDLDWTPEPYRIGRLLKDAEWHIRSFKSFLDTLSKSARKKELKARYQKQKFSETSTQEIKDVLHIFGAGDLRISDYKKHWWKIEKPDAL